MAGMTEKKPAPRTLSSSLFIRLTDRDIARMIALSSDGLFTKSALARRLIEIGLDQAERDRGFLLGQSRAEFERRMAERDNLTDDFRRPLSGSLNSP
jgi:hypothetical protein